jgi:hypothetical protein
MGKMKTLVILEIFKDKGIKMLLINNVKHIHVEVNWW